MNETDARFFIAKSPIPGAGYGLFAAQPLVAGETLIAIGIRIDRDSLADRCTAYADAYKFRVGDQLLIPIGFAGMVNHSSDAPNLEKVIEGHALSLRTLRNIAPGEELLFEYSQYAQDRFMSGIRRD